LAFLVFEIGLGVTALSTAPLVVDVHSPQTMAHAQISLEVRCFFMLSP